MTAATPSIQLAPPLIADSDEFGLIEEVLRSVLSAAWDKAVHH